MARRKSLLSILLSPPQKSSKRRAGVMCGPGGSKTGHRGGNKGQFHHVSAWKR